ncbi:protein of unknown function [Rhodovastum atsumiense]|nr:protein of unknown function [Rhodovastum atsumiense]
MRERTCRIPSTIQGLEDMLPATETPIPTALRLDPTDLCAGTALFKELCRVLARLGWQEERRRTRRGSRGQG